MITLNERGRRCPLPIIALAKAATSHPGETVTLLTDDPAAQYDVPAWCRMKSAELVSAEHGDDGSTFVVQLSKQG